MKQSANNILCGMYAFTPSLQNAWQEIFSNIHNYLPDQYSRPLNIIWSDDHEDFSNPQMLLGQTCGYPYIEKWHKSHRLLCVPEFEIEGCYGPGYSSWFITNSKDSRTNLSEFCNTTVAMNNVDSNSGMNVLRYAISQIAKGKRFFKSVITSQSHITSMQMAANGEVDLAAIDSVSYYQAIAQGIIKSKNLKVVSQSTITTGLPFIVHKNLAMSNSDILQAMNQSLEESSEFAKQTLKLKGFLAVSDSDYDVTRNLKKQAIENNYPLLQ